MISPLQKLAKWRRILMNWQVGNKPKGHLEADAIVDHREATLMLRAETSALISLLTQKKVFTEIEFAAQVDVEAEGLCKSYEPLFPGISVEDYGVKITVPEGAQTLAILYRQQPGPLIKEAKP